MKHDEPKFESMKYQFKKKSITAKDLDDMHFDDDMNDFGESRKEIRTKMRNKGRGQGDGKKPMFRSERQKQKKEKWSYK